MSSCFSNAKLLSSFVGVARRGYAASSQGAVSGSVRGSGVAMMKKGDDESTRSAPWIPDPVTGYYRPESHINQVDSAEVRELLSKQKTRRN